MPDDAPVDWGVVDPDEILDAIADQQPQKALRLYMRATPDVKRMIGGTPRDLLIQVDPQIQAGNVLDYIHARDKTDDVGMRRAYQSSNPRTRREIDELLK